LGGLLTNLAKWVGGKLAAGWNKLMDALDPVFSAISKIAGIVGGALMSGLRAIGNVIGNVVSWFGNLASVVGGALWSGLERVGSFIGGVLVAAFNGLVSGISTVVGWIGQLVDWFMNLAPVQAVIEGVRNVLSSLGDAASDLISNIVDAATGIADTIMSAFTSIDWGGAVSQVLDLITSGLSAGGAALGNLWGWLTDSLQSAFSSMRTALGNAIQLAWNSITSLNWGDWINPLNWATWIGGKIADFGSWLWEKIKGGFDAATDFIAGPIADF